MADRRLLFVESSLAEAFDFFDVDGSGFLERKELIELLKESEADTSTLLQQIDTNNDEKISKQEFLDYFKQLSDLRDSQ